MNKVDMTSPSFLVDQLEEALEEREGADRRKENAGADPTTGDDRREGDRRRRRKKG